MEALKDIPLQSLRLSDQIKNRLKGSIVDGDLKPGDKLPPEDQIARDLKVSKVTVREALREMESEGLIHKRRGIRGGSFIAEPNAGKISQVVTDYCRLAGLSPEELVEFRLLLEPAIVSLAAERRTEQDLAALRANIEECEQILENGVIDKQKGIEFHRLIGDACHNRLVSAVMQALVMVFEDVLAGVPMTLADGWKDLEYSKAFYRCIVSGEKEQAREVMAAHFDTLAEVIARQKVA